MIKDYIWIRHKSIYETYETSWNYRGYETLEEAKEYEDHVFSFQKEHPLPGFKKIIFEYLDYQLPPIDELTVDVYNEYSDIMRGQLHFFYSHVEFKDYERFVIVQSNVLNSLIDHYGTEQSKRIIDTFFSVLMEDGILDDEKRSSTEAQST